MAGVKVERHKRIGKCKRCGQCCDKVIRTSATEGQEIAEGMVCRSVRDLRRIFKELGFKIVSIDEYVLKGFATSWDVRLECTNLVDTKCKLHGTGKKPYFCTGFPGHPDTLCENCGFKWVRG